LYDKAGEYENRFLSLLIKDPNCRIVFSGWNIVEISKRRNMGGAISLARFVDKLNPLYILDRRNIQKAEIKKFVFQEIFKENFEFQAIRQFLSEVFYELGITQVPLMASTEKTVKAWMNNPGCMSEINEVENGTPMILRDLQEKLSAGLYTREKQEEVKVRSLKGLLPDTVPNGEMISNSEKELILERCLVSFKKILKTCPAFSVEWFSFDFRTGNPKRNPQRQDAIDLQHLVPALSYCDYFISNDGYVFDGSRFILKKCRTLPCKVFRDFASFIQAYESLDD
jgi:hypothetical protein